MARQTARSKRKPSGGKYHSFKKKKLKELAGLRREVIIGPKKIKMIRKRGGNLKNTLLSINYANVSKEGKSQKTEIISVMENKADPHSVRRNVITKGAIIQTKLGKAKVTSRPSQDGTVNAVLIE